MIRRIHYIFILHLLLLCCISFSAHAVEDSFDPNNWSKREKLIASNVAAFTLIGTWGVASWHYGERSAHFTSEDWFQEDTKHGGADKIGHTYASYGLSQLYSYYFYKWGYTKKDAALYGSISAFGLQGFMEIGDSFSEFGFSAQDFAMNTVGVVAGYYIYRNGGLGHYVDLRVEYIPTFTKYDVFTDYQGLKYLAAFKLSALEKARGNWLRYLEWHVGYYVRGYETQNEDKQRVLYTAIGVNLLELLKDKKVINPPHPVLSYYQIPYTYLEYNRDLNRD